MRHITAMMCEGLWMLHWEVWNLFHREWIAWRACYSFSLLLTPGLSPSFETTHWFWDWPLLCPWIDISSSNPLISTKCSPDTSSHSPRGLLWTVIPIESNPLIHRELGSRNPIIYQNPSMLRSPMFYFVSVSLWSSVKHPFNLGRCFACQLHKLSQVSH